MGRRLVLAAVALLLAGCSGWFGGGSGKKPLPGKRIPVLAFDRSPEADPSLAKVEVRLPRPYRNADWPQVGGTPSHAMHHLSAKGGLSVLWRDDIGEGGDDGMLLAQPVIAAGRVFAMDVKAEVRALDAETGGLLWRVRLAPRNAEGILGGGLAWNGGKLYVTTGFADVIALDAATGRELWRRRVSGPVRAAPTVYAGRVFAVTISNELFALDAADGRLLWNHMGITETAGLLGGASPAADGSTVVVPYSSGELFALRIENGRVVWSESLSALRRVDPVSSLSHIRGLPVIDRGQVIATSNSGRTIAIDLRTGSRIWERSVGSSNPPWVAGDFVYLVSNTGDLLCLSRRTGAVRWVRPLQRYEDEEDKEGPLVWSGPVLAGDRLIVGSSDGQLWSVSPYTGRLLGVVKVPGGVFLPAAVANDTVYVLTSDAKLLALR